MCTVHTDHMPGQRHTRSTLLWDSTEMQQQYLKLHKTVLPCCRLKHNGHGNAVHLNDVFFAVHAALLAGCTLIQCFIYDRGNQHVSKLCASAIGFTVAASCVSFMLVIFDSTRFPFLTFLYWLSWVKMGVTFFKYMPQVSMCRTTAFCSQTLCA